MKESGYYPLGAEHNSKAPWNQESLPEKEIEVLISITLSKTVKVKVSDYTIKECGKDRENTYYEEIDYSECNLKKAVEEQIYLPNQLNSACVMSNVSIPESIRKDFNNWNVDDLEIVLE